MKRLFIFSLLILTQCTLQAQSRRAQKYLRDAQENARIRDYEEALDDVNSALNSSPDYAEAWIFKADLHTMLGDAPEAAAAYEKAYEFSRSEAVLFRWGKACLSIGAYGKADSVLTAYLESPSASPRYIPEAESMRSDAQWAYERVQNPVPFELEMLPENVNSRSMQYFPSVSADGGTLMFTARDLEGDRKDEDFYETTLQNSTWTDAQSLPGGLNTQGNEGAMSLSADGTVIFYAGCQREDGYGSCDIYWSFLQPNGLWSPGRNLGESINSRAWETQPSISADGRTLFFVRGVRASAENTDIYYSRFENGHWSKAEKLEGTVNTGKNETSPYQHFDGKTLYFASNGHRGMGDSDLFVAEKQEDGSWGNVRNLGYPINTYRAEFAMAVAPDGRTAYYSSDRDRETDYNRLFTFQLPEDVRATPIAWVKGQVVDDESGAPVDAELQFVNLSTGETVLSERTFKGGRFHVSLPAKSDYALNVTGKGYEFYSENFELENQAEASAVDLFIELKKIEVGDVVVLNNIFYQYDSHELDARSKVELDRLIAYLTENSTVKLAVDGHTDNVGGAEYNQDLSLRRAHSLVNYLVENGIDSSRLQPRGFGETKPISDNETEEGRAKNRRTEITIIGL